MSGDRIVICGGPRTGKTTLSDSMTGGGEVLHTDDLIGMGWSEASQAAADWMARPGPWIVEGVAAVRALRKALDDRPDAPCDRLIWLTKPHEPLTRGQASMAKGCETVLAGIRAELLARGVTIDGGGD